MELRSPSEPISSITDAPCAKCQSPSPGLPACGHCGALQELPARVSHFAILGVPESLSLDEETLRERFYELSKRIHPDRFAQSDAREAMLATRWTTAVNRAYQTLRDPEKRTRYVLELHGSGDDKAAKIPFDLAEAYFEIQDLMEEEDGASRLSEFRAEMEDLLAETESAWPALAAEWDRTPGDRTILGRLAEHLTKLKYLRSMLADIEKKQGVSDAHRRD